MIDLYNSLTIDEILHLLPDEQIQHCMNVKTLVEAFTNWLPLSYEYNNYNIYKYYAKAAYYHDIGKAYIPLEITTKPGALTKEEYLIMQSHTLLSKEILHIIDKDEFYKEQINIIPLIHDAAAYHHEWWNGKGYPYGLSKNDIPFIARVTSICDAYDAIVSRRSYRKAYSHDYACKEIEKCAGIQFEPMLVRLFLDHEFEIFNLFNKSSVIA